jgi:hypothetical protein
VAAVIAEVFWDLKASNHCRNHPRRRFTIRSLQNGLLRQLLLSTHVINE